MASYVYWNGYSYTTKVTSAYKIPEGTNVYWDLGKFLADGELVYQFVFSPTNGDIIATFRRESGSSSVYYVTVNNRLTFEELHREYVYSGTGLYFSDDGTKLYYSVYTEQPFSGIMGYHELDLNTFTTRIYFGATSHSLRSPPRNGYAAITEGEVNSTGRYDGLMLHSLTAPYTNYLVFHEDGEPTYGNCLTNDWLIYTTGFGSVERKSRIHVYDVALKEHKTTGLPAELQPAVVDGGYWQKMSVSPDGRYLVAGYYFDVFPRNYIYYIFDLLDWTFVGAYDTGNNDSDYDRQPVFFSPGTYDFRIGNVTQFDWATKTFTSLVGSGLGTFYDLWMDANNPYRISSTEMVESLTVTGTDSGGQAISWNGMWVNTDSLSTLKDITTDVDGIESWDIVGDTSTLAVIAIDGSTTAQRNDLLLTELIPDE